VRHFAKNVLAAVTVGGLLAGCSTETAQTHIRTGSEHLAASRGEEAIAAFNAALAKSSECGEAYLGRGCGYLMEGKYARALRDFDKARRRLPVATHMLERYRGITYYELNRPRKAIECLTAALRLEPKDGICYRVRGLSFSLAGDRQRALADLGRAIELDPDDGHMYVDRAGIYVDMGRFGEAAADIQQALRLLPENGYAYLVRSLIHAHQGDLKASRADHRRSMELDPSLRILPRRDIMRTTPEPIAGRSEDSYSASAG
jgi:tetratricopeptide (TPR) repeat protein